jgi:hypothetical protein
MRACPSSPYLSRCGGEVHRRTKKNDISIKLLVPLDFARYQRPNHADIDFSDNEMVKIVRPSVVISILSFGSASEEGSGTLLSRLKRRLVRFVILTNLLQRVCGRGHIVGCGCLCEPWKLQGCWAAARYADAAAEEGGE